MKRVGSVKDKIGIDGDPTGVPVGVIMPLLRFGYWSLVGLSLATEIAAFLLMGGRRRLHLQRYAAAARSGSSF